MISKKFDFSIFVLVCLFLVLESCDKKTVVPADTTSRLAAIDHLIDLGDHHFANLKYDSAYYYHNKAKSLCDLKTDNTRIIYSLARMSEIQQNQGDFAGSETTAIEAIPFLNKTIDPAYECSIYNLLGIVYTKLYDYDNALLYYK